MAQEFSLGIDGSCPGYFFAGFYQLLTLEWRTH
jgi:hypothetical protein